MNLTQSCAGLTACNYKYDSPDRTKRNDFYLKDTDRGTFHSGSCLELIWISQISNLKSSQISNRAYFTLGRAWS